MSSYTGIVGRDFDPRNLNNDDSVKLWGTAANKAQKAHFQSANKDLSKSTSCR